jgi:hypothetical protein
VRKVGLKSSTIFFFSWVKGEKDLVFDRFAWKGHGGICGSFDGNITKTIVTNYIESGTQQVTI